MANQISANEQSPEAATATATTTPAPAPAPAPEAEPSAGPGWGHKASGPTTAEIDAFRVDCLMNARYHAAREGFLNGAHRWLMFFVIIFGASSVIDALNDILPIKGMFGAIAAVFGAVDLVFDLSNRACAHSLMKRRYFELLSSVQEQRISIDQAHAEMSKFSADEEPAFHALLLLSWNSAEEMVFGEKAYRYNIGFWARMTKNLCRFEGKKFSLIKQAI